MNPTGFFLLTLLLVLVTETASRKTRGEWQIDLKALGGSGGSSSSHEEYSSSEGSWSSFKSKKPKSIVTEEVYEERRHKQRSGDSGDGDRSGESAGEMESFTRRKAKQRFGQEMNK
nr:seminal vesicle secretory protein 6-like [Peromyscus maniculatus bairdii]